MIFQCALELMQSDLLTCVLKDIATLGTFFIDHVIVSWFQPKHLFY